MIYGVYYMSCFSICQVFYKSIVLFLYDLYGLLYEAFLNFCASYISRVLWVRYVRHMLTILHRNGIIPHNIYDNYDISLRSETDI